MTEQESLLLDLGNAVGVFVFLACCFVVAIGIGLIYNGIKDSLK